MKNQQNYQALASAIVAYGNCINSNNQEWQDRWKKQIAEIVSHDFPHGSGFDSGTKFDLSNNLRFNGEKLVFTTAFHHMNEGGMYDGWSEHVVIVSPSLAYGFTVKISGRDRNEIKEYIAEMFHAALSADCTVQA